MLVVSRRKFEGVHIGDDVVVEVVDIRESKVRLGISAPQQTPVHRHEVYLEIRKQQANSPRQAPPTPTPAVAPPAIAAEPPELREALEVIQAERHRLLGQRVVDAHEVRRQLARCESLLRRALGAACSGG